MIGCPKIRILLSSRQMPSRDHDTGYTPKHAVRDAEIGTTQMVSVVLK